MIRYKKIAICFCVAVVLVCNLGGAAVLADDSNRDADNRVHLYAVSTFGPIGTVESLQEVTVNGRTLSGRQMIWGNELLRAPVNTCAQVTVDGVGQITLKQNTILRLATSRTTLNDNKGHPLFIASLTSGEIAVKLYEGACAYVEAAGSAVTAVEGANFRVAIREGRAIVDPASGEVEVSSIIMSQGAPDKIRFGELRADSAGGYPFIESPPALDFIGRESRSLQTRVTGQNDKPIPDVPVIFALSSKSLGMFPGGATTFTTTTNAQGIATAPFTAGPSSTTGTMTATVEGTNVSQTIEVNVRSKTSSSRKFIAAGAVVVLLTSIIIISDPGSPQPLTQVPPPTIP